MVERVGEFLHLDRLNLVEEDTVFELSFSNIHPAGPTEKLDNSGIFPDIGASEMDILENFSMKG